VKLSPAEWIEDDHFENDMVTIKSKFISKDTAKYPIKLKGETIKEVTEVIIKNFKGRHEFPQPKDYTNLSSPRHRGNKCIWTGLDWIEEKKGNFRVRV